MMGQFSDHLDPDEPDAVEFDQPAPPRPRREQPPVNGPDPRQMPEVQVVDLFATVKGVTMVPDIVDRAEVEARIKALTPADLQGEILLPAGHAAQFLGMSEGTLKVWRDKQINLRFYIAPAAGMFNQRRIFYRVSDLVRYREFVMVRVSPVDVRMPPPGVLGVPSALDTTPE